MKAIWPTDKYQISKGEIVTLGYVLLAFWGLFFVGSGLFLKNNRLGFEQ
jgi:hypothetical protein